MNRIYKVIRCNATGVFKAVPEFAKSGKKTKVVSASGGVVEAPSAALGRVFSKSTLSKSVLMLGFGVLSAIPAQADYGSDSREMIYELQDQVQRENVTIGAGAKSTIPSPSYSDLRQFDAYTNPGNIAIGENSNAQNYKPPVNNAEYDRILNESLARIAQKYGISVDEYRSLYYNDNINLSYKNYHDRDATNRYHESIGQVNTALGANTIAKNGGTAIGSSSYSDEVGTVSFGTHRRVLADGTSVEAITRRLTNVSDGIAETDAATVGQLQLAVKDLGSSEIFTEALEVKADKATVDAKNNAQDELINTAINTNNNQDAAIQTNKNNITINKNNITTNTNDIAQNKIDISKKADKTYVDAEDKKLRDTAASNKQALEASIASTKSALEAVDRTQNTSIATNKSDISKAKTDITALVAKNKAEISKTLTDSVETLNTKNTNQDALISGNTKLIGETKAEILDTVSKNKAEITSNIKSNVESLDAKNALQDKDITANKTLINTTKTTILNTVAKDKADINASLKRNVDSMDIKNTNQDKQTFYLK